MSRRSPKGSPGNDSFVAQLGDRLSGNGDRKVLPLRRPDDPRGSGHGAPDHAQVPPSEAFPPPPSQRAQDALGAGLDDDSPTFVEDQSDIHAVPPAEGEDDVLEAVPYVEHSPDEEDPFAQFEDHLEGESTRIDTQHLIAEQTTNILEESPDPPYLEVEHGKDVGKQFVLNPGETSVGRSIDNDVILTDIAVSRRHLKVLVQEDGSLRLHDLGSGNGTQLNGRRVYDSPLSDGDRIELGETTLQVCIPSELAVLEDGDMEDMVGPDRDDSATDEEMLPSMPPPATAGIPTQPPGAMDSTAFVKEGARGVMTDYIPSPRGTESSGVVVPRGWLLAGVVVGGLLVALLGATITALLMGDGAEGPEVASIDQAPQDPQTAFARGEEAFEAKRWDDAQEAFEQVLSDSPGDERAQRYLQQIAEAREHSEILSEARAALSEGDAETALTHAASIPESSPAAAEAEAIRLAAHDLHVRELVRQGNAALEGGDLEVAEAKLEEARSLAEDDEGVQELAAAIAELGEEDGEEANEEPQRPTRRDRARRAARQRQARSASSSMDSSPAARRRSGGNQAQSRVLSLYRQGSFSAAVSAARSAADSASDSDRRELLSLAERIEQFARAYQSAQSAGFSPSAVRPMQSAVSLDNRISGGHYARSIQPRLLDAYLTRARSALGSGNESSGCQAVRQALAIDSANAAARRLAQTCEQRAQQLISRARGLERSNPQQAIQLYRQVMTMVPRGSSLATTAYQRQNQLARRQAYDEDE